MQGQMTEVFRFRVPKRLLKALEKESFRRMTSKSSLARLALARELGLIDEAGDNAIREARDGTET
jgi:hypothetical protein